MDLSLLWFSHNSFSVPSLRHSPICAPLSPPSLASLLPYSSISSHFNTFPFKQNSSSLWFSYGSPFHPSPSMHLPSPLVALIPHLCFTCLPPLPLDPAFSLCFSVFSPLSSISFNSPTFHFYSPHICARHSLFSPLHLLIFVHHLSFSLCVIDSVFARHGSFFSPSKWAFSVYFMSLGFAPLSELFDSQVATHTSILAPRHVPWGWRGCDGSRKQTKKKADRSLSVASNHTGNSAAKGHGGELIGEAKALTWYVCGAFVACACLRG